MYAASLLADSASFNQRFGVNGYLTSLPLYYKDHEYYNDSKVQKKRRERKQKYSKLYPETRDKFWAHKNVQ